MLVDGLYVHIPFCASKCNYCAFESDVASAKKRTTYLEDIFCLYEKLGFQASATLYVGGGTPSLLGDSLQQLVQEMMPQNNVETTMEVNPDSAGFELFSHLKKAGVTRVSIGVQSLQEAELHALGRKHSARQALDCIRDATRIFQHVSVDVMVGVPHQTQETLAATLNELVELPIDHMSLYPLQIEEGTPFAKLDPQVFADEDRQADLLVLAENTLTKAGFSRYETANFARSGGEAKHNIGYWTGKSYVGIGRGASSCLSPAQWTSFLKGYGEIPDLPAETVRIRTTQTTIQKTNVQLEVECLNKEQALAEDLMLQARLKKGIDPQLISQAHETFLLWDAVSESLINDGLLQNQQNQRGLLVPTHRGWLLGNELFGRLWGLASEAPKTLTLALPRAQ